MAMITLTVACALLYIANALHLKPTQEGLPDRISSTTYALSTSSTWHTNKHLANQTSSAGHHLHIQTKAKCTIHTNKQTLIYLAALLITNAHDTETNPGPHQPLSPALDITPPDYPCGACGREVADYTNAVQCDNCDQWFHAACEEIPLYIFQCLQSSNAVWDCLLCGLPNLSSGLFSNPTSQSNQFSILSSLSDSIDSPGIPVHASSPKQPQIIPRRRQPKLTPPPLKIAVINFRSIRNKKALLDQFIAQHRPDIVLGTESWLTEEINTNEYFPPSYQVLRKDRQTHTQGGGIFIAINNAYIATPCPELDTNCELCWYQLKIVGSKTIYIGSFYRPPNASTETMEELGKALSRIPQGAHVILGGDFNLPHINWTIPTALPSARNQEHCNMLIDLMEDNGLQQMVHDPT